MRGRARSNNTSLRVVAEAIEAVGFRPEATAVEAEPGYPPTFHILSAESPCSGPRQGRCWPVLGGNAVIRCPPTGSPGGSRLRPVA